MFWFQLPRPTTAWEPTTGKACSFPTGLRENGQGLGLTAGWDKKQVKLHVIKRAALVETTVAELCLRVFANIGVDLSTKCNKKVVCTNICLLVKSELHLKYSLRRHATANFSLVMVDATGIWRHTLPMVTTAVMSLCDGVASKEKSLAMAKGNTTSDKSGPGVCYSTFRHIITTSSIWIQCYTVRYNSYLVNHISPQQFFSLAVTFQNTPFIIIGSRNMWLTLLFLLLTVTCNDLVEMRSI